MMASTKTPPSTTETTVTAQRSRFGTNFSRSPPVARRLDPHLWLCASVPDLFAAPASHGGLRGGSRLVGSNTLRRNPAEPGLARPVVPAFPAPSSTEAGATPNEWQIPKPSPAGDFTLADLPPSDTSVAASDLRSGFTIVGSDTNERSATYDDGDDEGTLEDASVFVPPPVAGTPTKSAPTDPRAPDASVPGSPLNIDFFKRRQEAQRALDESTDYAAGLIEAGAVADGAGVAERSAMGLQPLPPGEALWAAPSGRWEPCTALLQVSAGPITALGPAVAGRRPRRRPPAAPGVGSATVRSARESTCNTRSESARFTFRGRLRTSTIATHMVTARRGGFRCGSPLRAARCTKLCGVARVWVTTAVPRFTWVWSPATCDARSWQSAGCSQWRTARLAGSPSTRSRRPRWDDASWHGRLR